LVEFAQIIQQSLAPLNIRSRSSRSTTRRSESTFQAYNYDMFIDYAINDISGSR